MSNKWFLKREYMLAKTIHSIKQTNAENFKFVLKYMIHLE